MRNRKSRVDLARCRRGCAIAVHRRLRQLVEEDRAAHDGRRRPTTATSGENAALASLNGKLDGGGSSFQDTFEQKASSDFDAAVKAAGGNTTITYTKSGSSDGKKGLADKSLDFAGTDSAIKPEEEGLVRKPQDPVLPDRRRRRSRSPTTSRGVDKLSLSADTLAKIFQAQITTWNDPAIKADNPGATLPSTKIAVVHRSDGSGTTSNFTKFLVAASPDRLEARRR